MDIIDCQLPLDSRPRDKPALNLLGCYMNRVRNYTPYRLPPRPVLASQQEYLISLSLVHAQPSHKVMIHDTADIFILQTDNPGGGDENIYLLGWRT